MNVIASIRILFLLQVRALSDWLLHILLISSSVALRDAGLCLYLGAIMDNDHPCASFMWTYVFCSLGFRPRGRISGSYDDCVLPLERLEDRFLKWLHHFTFHLQSLSPSLSWPIVDADNLCELKPNLVQSLKGMLSLNYRSGFSFFRRGLVKFILYV